MIPPRQRIAKGTKVKCLFSGAIGEVQLSHNGRIVVRFSLASGGGVTLTRTRNELEVVEQLDSSAKGGAK